MHVIRLTLLLALSLSVAACGGASSPLAGGSGPDPSNFKSGIDHAYLPMAFGTVWILEGTHEGLPLREEVHALEEPRAILGIPCLALREEVFHDEVLVELTTEWFAQDRAGNVWKFGEESVAFEGERFGRTEDSWIAGEGDAVPWMAFPAQPEVGQVLIGYRPTGRDILVITSLTETVTTPAGTFQACMKVEEETDDPDDPDAPDDKDIILYAPETGRVEESNPAGKVVLVESRR